MSKSIDIEQQQISEFFLQIVNNDLNNTTEKDTSNQKTKKQKIQNVKIEKLIKDSLFRKISMLIIFNAVKNNLDFDQIAGELKFLPIDEKPIEELIDLINDNKEQKKTKNKTENLEPQKSLEEQEAELANQKAHEVIMSIVDNDVSKMSLLNKIDRIKDFTKHHYRDAYIVRNLIEDPIFIKIVNLTFDKTIKFGLRVEKAIEFLKDIPLGDKPIDQLLDLITDDAYQALTLADEEAREIILRILKRDLQVGINKRTLIKLGLDLNVLPYMRCSHYTQATQSKIEYPCYAQEKMDGMYVALLVDEDGEVTFKSRANKVIEHDKISNVQQVLDLKLPAGMYTGEAIIEGQDRFASNGLMNSKQAIEVTFKFWDYVVKNDKRTYEERFNNLQKLMPVDWIVEWRECQNIDEISSFYNEVINRGGEGLVIKNYKGLWKSGTSLDQFKYKQVHTLDLRITEFFTGKARTKNEGKISAFGFSSDDGYIKGRCAGLTESDSKLFSEDFYIGSIVEIECNGISRSKNKDTYALMHPRFIKIRLDKTETDTLSRALEFMQVQD